MISLTYGNTNIWQVPNWSSRSPCLCLCNMTVTEFRLSCQFQLHIVHQELSQSWCEMWEDIGRDRIGLDVRAEDRLMATGGRARDKTYWHIWTWSRLATILAICLYLKLGSFNNLSWGLFTYGGSRPPSTSYHTKIIKLIIPRVFFQLERCCPSILHMGDRRTCWDVRIKEGYHISYNHHHHIHHHHLHT